MTNRLVKNKIETLLFSGGGIRGIAYLGCLKYLEESHLDLSINEVCGVSVGSIIAFLYVLGYTSDQLKEYIFEKDLSKLKKISFVNFVYHYGLDSGENVIEWLESFILLKYNKTRTLTFKELYDLNPVKLNILAANLSKYNYTQFNHTSTPDLPILDAIRMSISIPMMFTKKTFDGDIHVDGGLIGSYPIKLYKDKLDTLLGFKLISIGEQDEDVHVDVKSSLESYIYNIFNCYTAQREKYTVISEEYQKHTVYIHSKDITQLLKFKLSIDDKAILFDLGYNTTRDAIKCTPFSPLSVSTDPTLDIDFPVLSHSPTPPTETHTDFFVI